MRGIPAEHPLVRRGFVGIVGRRTGDRGEVRESDPVRPVAECHARAVLPYVLPPVAAMVELQLLTGMRPGEVCRMRPCDMDTTGAAWVYPAGPRRPPTIFTLSRGSLEPPAVRLRL